MFDAVGATGSLMCQLVYFRGLGECRASPFVPDAAALKLLMTRHRLPRRPYPDRQGADACAESRRRGHKVNALVFIGDAMEETIDDLAEKAGGLGLLGVPVFVFQEGHDSAAPRRRSGKSRGCPSGLGSDLIGGLPRLLRDCFRRLRSSRRAG